MSVTVSPDDPGLIFYSEVRMDWFNLFMSIDLNVSEYYFLIRNSFLKSSIKQIQENKANLLKQAKQDILKFFNSPRLIGILKKWDDLKKAKKAEIDRALRIIMQQKKVRVEMINEKNKFLENSLKSNADKIIDKNNNPYINVYDIDDLLSFSRQSTIMSRIRRSKIE